MARVRHDSDVEYLGERPVKRPRVSCPLNTAYMPTPPAWSSRATAELTPSQQLNDDLRSLSDAQAKRILVQFAPLIPELAYIVNEKCSQRRERESRLTRIFDSQVEQAVSGTGLVGLSLLV